MTSVIARAARPKPAKARNLLINLAWCVAATLVEVFCALELGGWLAVALWVVIARNLLFLTLAMIGLAGVAAEAINTERARP